MGSQDREWPSRLFVDNPDLFLPFLEARVEAVKDHAAHLAKLLKELGVPEGGSVLDLACGIGRFSVPLAQLGYRVVALDLSPAYVERAKAYAKRMGVADETRFQAGDMRDLAELVGGKAPFDAIVSLFTSFSYYGERADRDVLSQLGALAGPHGVLVLETVNRDWVLRNFVKSAWRFEGNMLLLETREYDSIRSHIVNRWTFYRREGEVLRPGGEFVVDHRIYGPVDLAEMLRASGWRLDAMYGNFRRDPIDLQAPDRGRLVVTARKR